ncbi:hypothetical protein DDI_2515 [Dickeya dianthicola RNS04.9]|nr:hypothetical protein DDI_2515 [Dickeya dianthicola RNS04.9]
MTYQSRYLYISINLNVENIFIQNNCVRLLRYFFIYLNSGG